MKRFFALSRTTHGVLDIAAPAFCALLWLGDFPYWQIILLSLFTAFAAYTAVYTLNDLVGIAVDREKFNGGINSGYSVEASALRYPLAQNVLPFQSGLLWFFFWFAIAMAGSYFLNPAIVIILSAATILEIIYCLLLKVTYWRILFSGLVKASGPIAAVFVVDSNPTPEFVLLIFFWVLFWEIGGQNIPADWNDTAEDKRVNAKTIPIFFGRQKSRLLVMLFLCLTVITSMFLPLVSPVELGWPYLTASGLAGVFLLIKPGFDLYQQREDRLAGRLFDRASYYPLVQFVIISIFVIML